MSISTLLEVSARYGEVAGGLPAKTVSHRVFRDSKLLDRLQGGAEITVGRYNMAMCWFARNWPAEAMRPAVLNDFVSPDPGVAAE